MILQAERERLVSYGKKMIAARLSRGTEGNLSICDRARRLVAITPSGMDYFELRPEDIVVTDFDGAIVDGKRRPSVELPLHRIFYERRTDIGAIVHCHSVYAAVLATLREPLPTSGHMVGLAGGEVRCAPYATGGTQALAEVTFEGMRGRYAVLMANHGLTAGDATLEKAFAVAEQVEFCAEVYVKARGIGMPKILDAEEMDKVICRLRKKRGQEGEGSN